MHCCHSHLPSAPTSATLLYSSVDMHRQQAMEQVEMLRALKSDVGWGLADEVALPLVRTWVKLLSSLLECWTRRNYSQSHVRSFLRAIAWIHAGIQPFRTEHCSIKSRVDFQQNLFILALLN